MTSFRAVLAAFTVATSLLVAAPAVAKDRSGTVIAMDPIENRGDDEAQSTKKKRSIGGAWEDYWARSQGPRSVGQRAWLQ